jgi:hypothetical protein
MRQPRRFTWPDLPVAIGAGILAVLSLLMIAQLLILLVKPGKPMKIYPQLIGAVRPPEVVPLTLHNLVDGRYQAVTARQIGTDEPLFPLAVRIRNQVEFSVFGVLPFAQVVYGGNLELLDAGYIESYCTRNLREFMAAAPDRANQILRMQQYAERRGQTFLYIITPSKVALYPNFMPPGQPCAASQIDRTALVPNWVAMLRKKGVHVVDTESVLSPVRNSYAFPLYPRGGIHWNQVGSALAAQAIAASIAAQRADRQPSPFTFTWTMAKPSGMDNDLSSLLNLFWLPAALNVPEVSFHEKPATPGCRKLRVVIVAGSFMEAAASALSWEPCLSPIVQYYYWHTSRFIWVNGQMTTQMFESVDPALRTKDLLNADIIIYEENESLLIPPLPQHGQAFYQWLVEHEKL